MSTTTIEALKAHGLAFCARIGTAFEFTVFSLNDEVRISPGVSVFEGVTSFSKSLLVAHLSRRFYVGMVGEPLVMYLGRVDGLGCVHVVDQRIQISCKEVVMMVLPPGEPPAMVNFSSWVTTKGVMLESGVLRG